MLDASEECTILLENREKRGCTLLRQRRRRAGRTCPLANGRASGEESGESDGEDDIPLAVLQRVKAMEQKQEMKRNRRKKRRLKLELKKKSRPKSRANLSNACTLSSLPAAEGDTDIEKIDGNQFRLHNSEEISLAPIPSTQDREYKEMDEVIEYFDEMTKQLDKKEEEERDNDIDYFENAVRLLETSAPTSRNGDEPMPTHGGVSQPVGAVDSNLSFLDPELSDGTGTDFCNGGGDSLGGDDECDIVDSETDDSDSEDGSDDDDDEFNPSTYLDRVNRALQSLPYLELMHYLDTLHRDIEEQKLPYARKRLRALGDNFDRIQNQFGGLNDEKEELEDLLDECAALHEFSVKELIRNGIDKVNGAISRMQKERRANLPKMNTSQQRLFSRQMIEVRDMRALNLNEDISSTDTGITKLRKAVARELQLASDSTNVVAPIVRRRREKKAQRPRKNLDDRHCHASRKRQRQRGSKRSGGMSIDIQLDATDKSALAKRLRDGEVDSEGCSSTSDDDDLALSALEKLEPKRSSKVQFVGETDETDTNQSSYLPAAKRQRRVASSQGHRAGGSGVFDDNRSRSSHRPSKSDTNRMLEWCSKQNHPDTRFFQHDQEARGRKPGRRADATAEGSSRTGLQARMMVNSGSRGSNDSAEDEPSGRRKSKGTAGTKRIRPSGSAPTTRPPVSKHLSIERLFSQLEARGCNIRAEAIPPVTETKMISELCAELQKCLTRTNESRVSREILKQLGSFVYHEGDGIQDCDVALLYETMGIVLRHKCSTLLDLIQSVPEWFFVQVECWHVVFIMAEKKLHRRGAGGSAWLRNAKNCANHILLQVVDALYSQLLWEEYGMPSPSFRDIVFEYLKSLCAAVDRVLPLLPAVYEIMTSKRTGLGPLRWRLSRMTERKENDPGSILFVSAIDPALHVKFISTGEPILCSQVGPRMKSFNKMIPRHEIDAVWALIGFFSSKSADGKPLELLVHSLITYRCGSLPSFASDLAPNQHQLQTASKEVKRISVLLSSECFGTLPSIDTLMRDVVNNAVALEAASNHGSISRRGTDPNGRTTAELWEACCCKTSSIELIGLLDSHDYEQNSLSLAPSTELLTNCYLFVITFASMCVDTRGMLKKAKWKRIRGSLQAMIANFSQTASRAEILPANETTKEDTFASAFRHIGVEDEDKIRADLSKESYFREAASYLMIACIVARSRHDVTGDVGTNSSLTKQFRCDLWKCCSDESMRRHLDNLLQASITTETPGGSSKNLWNIYTSAKVMSSLALQYFKADPKEPAQICLDLSTHLTILNMEDDAESLEFILTSLVSCFMQCADALDVVNRRKAITERSQDCDDHFHTTLSCLTAIRSISSWLAILLRRAQFILNTIDSEAPAIDDKLLQLRVAITRLDSPRLFANVTKGALKALKSINEVNSMNALSMQFRGNCEGAEAVSQAFRTCLSTVIGTTSAMRSSRGEASLYPTVQMYLQLLPLMNQGGLYRILSGAICRVLAEVCTLDCTSQTVSDIYRLFSQLATSSCANDAHILDVKACFTSELVRLADSEPVCHNCLLQHKGEVTTSTLHALIDADTLYLFPTSDLATLCEVGGQSCRAQGEKDLSKAQIIEEGTVPSPDREARNIDMRTGDVFDTAGPSYMSHNVWTFVDNTGKIVKEFANLGGLNKDTQPEVCLERECLRRLEAIRSFIRSLRGDSTEEIPGNPLRQVTTLILKNLCRVSSYEVSVEKSYAMGCNDFESRLNRAKLLVFVQVYAHMCGSILSVILMENGSDSDVLTNNIIIPALRGDLNLIRAIKGLSDQLCPRRQFTPASSSNEKATLKYVTRALKLSLFRRSPEFISLCQDRHSNSFGAALFNALLSAAYTFNLDEEALANDFFKVVCNHLILKDGNSGHAHASSSNYYHREVEPRLDATSRSDTLVRLDFRQRILEVLGPRILTSQGGSSILRSVILQLLSHLFRTFSRAEDSEMILDDAGNLSGVGTYAKVCCSLKLCLSNAVLSCQPDIIANLFICANRLTHLPVAVHDADYTKSLIDWASASFSSSRNAEFIVETFKWLGMVGSLLSSDSGNLRSILHDTDPIASNNSETRLLILTRKLAGLETELSLSDQRQRANPYAKKAQLVSNATLPLNVQTRRAIMRYCSSLPNL